MNLLQINEMLLIERLYAALDNNLTKTAEVLGVNRTTLLEKRKRLADAAGRSIVMRQGISAGGRSVTQEIIISER